MKDLNQKVVLITGATGGFGREMCKQFMAEGARVLATDMSEEALANLQNEIGAGKNASKPGEYLGHFAANLGTAAGCAEVFERAGRLSTTVDVLVNNAGITQIGQFVDLPDDEWEKTIDINLLAPMRLTKLFLPGMVERGAGHIVNISSAAGLAGAITMAPYSASKFGLRGFGDAIAGEVASKGVNVTNVYPFFSRTNILKSERFGDAHGDRELPDWVISEPADIVRQVVKGVKKDERHVYPDAGSRMTDLTERFIPSGLQFYKKFIGQ